MVTLMSRRLHIRQLRHLGRIVLPAETLLEFGGREHRLRAVLQQQEVAQQLFDARRTAGMAVRREPVTISR